MQRRRLITLSLVTKKFVQFQYVCYKFAMRRLVTKNNSHLFSPLPTSLKLNSLERILFSLDF